MFPIIECIRVTIALDDASMTAESTYLATIEWTRILVVCLKLSASVVIFGRNLNLKILLATHQRERRSCRRTVFFSSPISSRTSICTPARILLCSIMCSTTHRCLCIAKEKKEKRQHKKGERERRRIRLSLNTNC